MDYVTTDHVDISFIPDNLVDRIDDNSLTQEEDYFLQQLETIGVKEVFPTFTYHGVEYDCLRPIKDFYTGVEMHLLLESLAGKGYLKEFNLGTVLLCPECSSPVVMITLICNECGSTKVKKIDIIQHIECGYRAEESKFLDGKTMTCPQCNIALESSSLGETHRVVSSKYSCDSCGKNIEKAQTILHCLKCKNKFKHGEAVKRNPKGYIVVDKNQRRIQQEDPLEESIESTQDEIENKDDYQIIVDKEPAPSTDKEQTEEESVNKEDVSMITVSDDSSPLRFFEKDVLGTPSGFSDMSFIDSPMNGLKMQMPNVHLPKIELPKLELPSISLTKLVAKLTNWDKKPKEALTMSESGDIIAEMKQEIRELAEGVNVNPESELSILLIEDQKIHADLILSSLEQDGGLNVVHADSGKNGLKELRNKYDVVIVDTSLGDMEADLIMSEMAKWKVDTPVILLTEDVESQTSSVTGEAHILDRSLGSYKSLPRVIHNIPSKYIFK
jgi:CheY-like chemotaxis protein/ribosomal protein L37AE/L43A